MVAQPRGYQIQNNIRSTLTTRFQWLTVVLAVLFCIEPLSAKTPDGHTKIILIAGTRSPRKAGGEEYLKSVRLLDRKSVV